jgi:CO/xanthine dehydrogenase Mo-binding subunit
MADAYHQLFRTYKERPCNLPVCGIPVTFQSAKAVGTDDKVTNGFGFTFARYKNLAAYCAVATEVEVNQETGRPRLVRAVAAVDSGQEVNPDGLINQIKGAIVQSMSWTLYESDDARITSIDWQTYPIRRFNSSPPTASRCMSSTGPASLSSAAAKPGRDRPRHRSQMPLPTLPASGSANCP